MIWPNLNLRFVSLSYRRNRGIRKLRGVSGGRLHLPRVANDRPVCAEHNSRSTRFGLFAIVARDPAADEQDFQLSATDRGALRFDFL